MGKICPVNLDLEKISFFSKSFFIWSVDLTKGGKTFVLSLVGLNSMKFILGRKLQMTQRYDDSGRVIPVTVVEAGPCRVVQVKTREKEGYNAVQIGFGASARAGKSMAGHQKDKSHDDKYWRHLKEFRVEEVKLNPGDWIKAENFSAGEIISVTGTSKGRGFAGVVKRHHFAGHPSTHGHKDQERMPGSIGSGGVQRVFKGTRMGGRMGNDRVTVKNLQIIDIDPAGNLLFIKGPVPGARNTLLLIRTKD